MIKDNMLKLQFALAAKGLSRNKPVAQITVDELNEATKMSDVKFNDCFNDIYELIEWYCNYAGEELVKESASKDWSEIVTAIVRDIRSFPAFYRPMFDGDERPDLIYPLTEMTFRFMKTYAELNGNTLTDNDLFLLDFITAGTIYVTKTWLLETGCAMNSGALASKIVYAYPVSMRGIFK